MKQPTALIVGVGDGLSASLARLLQANGYTLVLAARNTEKLTALAAETGAALHVCDAAEPAAVESLFASLSGELRLVVYNPSARSRGPVAELAPADVQQALNVTAFGAFLVGQKAAERMLAQPAQSGVRGTILFTGASAGVKGFPQSAPFAMGKFAQRGLAQSMSRELHPQGVHVAWVNIDGAIQSDRRTPDPDQPDAMLDPDAIATSYLSLLQQHRSTWSSELTIRPWVEVF